MTADYHRAAIALNLGEWSRSLANASRLVGLYPECNFVVAIAGFELGHVDRILPGFLHAALNYPRAARLLFGTAARFVPRSYDDHRDHTCGVALRNNLHGYLAQRPSRATRYFRALLKDPRVAQLLDDVLAARLRREHQHAAGEREAFDYLHRVHSPAFAAETAEALADLLPRSAKPFATRSSGRP